ncbi:RNA-directed DNA polymerase, eukaryota, reverse transcriptase zinc-binding domain protein [Tanacetum coccineum]|uniref:RNA-directed DNA polymerase, eukaryota, reverse transcriptase zinc-binding domain protein n=1 Tax=Tanacetum coccineum TaxID=301880 RepID=A0ABQ5HXE5_9ASTR
MVKRIRKQHNSKNAILQDTDPKQASIDSKFNNEFIRPKKSDKTNIAKPNQKSLRRNLVKMNTISEEAEHEGMEIKDAEDVVLKNGDLEAGKDGDGDLQNGVLKNGDEVMGNDLGGTNSEGFNSDNVRSNELFDTEISLGGGNEGVSAIKSGVKATDVEVEAGNGMCWDNDGFHAMKDSGNHAGVNDQYKATDRVSFASIAQGMANSGSNKLRLVPFIVDKNGKKLVDLDPIVKEGSQKWELTVIGYFVGMKMGYREISRHLRRMWRMYDLDKIIVLDNGLYFFKFRSEEGMQTVIENRPWLVDQKPLFVMKWEAGLCLTKPVPTCVLIGYKSLIFSLEAWNPSYARVLIEVHAIEGLVDNIEEFDKKIRTSKPASVQYVPVSNKSSKDPDGFENVSKKRKAKVGEARQSKKGIQEEIQTQNRFSPLNEEVIDVAMGDGQDSREMSDIGYKGNSRSGTIKKKIQMLEREVSERSRNIGSTTNSNDTILAKEKMKETGLSMNLTKHAPLTEEVKDTWTDEMVEYYGYLLELRRGDEVNGHFGADDNDDMSDEAAEVAEDLSTHASFMTQNVIASWNIRGMASDITKKDEVRNLIFSNNIECSRGCRIIVGWDPNTFSATLLSKSDQVMHFLVAAVTDGKIIYVSFVYGENVDKDRVLLGDFNVTLFDNENTHPNVRGDYGVRDFKDCVDNLGVEDIPMTGMFFTWIQKRQNPESGILKKLDRIMGNCHFLEEFKACVANFLPYNISDHTHALLTINEITSKKPKPSRFMNFLADKPEFLGIVKDNWNAPVDGFAMFRKKCSKAKRELNKSLYLTELRERELLCSNSYKSALLDEERLLRQKSKIEWLKEGDLNNAYFHNSLKGRLNKCIIEIISDEDGESFTGVDVADKFVEHFQKIFGVEGETYPVDDPTQLFSKKISQEDALEMVKPISNEEIKSAIFDIEDNKAPGPDGFTSKFFKASWGIVGGDVCRAIKEFFSSGKMLGELNTTIISLMPKSKNPGKAVDYKPIACCGVFYKCISKVITNRIKIVLNKLVDPNQGAFIEGRQISDNILLIQELMNGYTWKNKIRRCAFKVDIQKAYDTVSWDFLKMSLDFFGFPSKMVNWIMVCLSTASFSVNVNGSSHGFFKAKRGLRQGDPVSPYLFTIIMEVFNLMVKRQISLDKRFKFHWGCKEMGITHLCFADDLMLLCHADKISASILIRALDEFSLTSGLYPSMTKSTVYFGNVPNDVKCSILMFMPFNEGNLPAKYLGVPLVSRKLHKDDCKFLVECVVKRIIDWRNRCMSYAGRLQLISSILSSLQSGNDKNLSIASVAWKDICMPKCQGVLGLKSLQTWNQALMTKHLWNILDNKNSIWVRWINLYWLKGHSVWSCVSNKQISWCWKEALETILDRPLSRDINKDTITAAHLSLSSKVRDTDAKTHTSISFLTVLFSKRLWERLKIMARLEDISNVWGEVVSGIANRLAKNGIWSIIQRLVLGAAVYFIWQERNYKLFRKCERSNDKLFSIITETVRLKVMGLKIIRTSPDVMRASGIWGFPLKQNIKDNMKNHVPNQLLDPLLLGDPYVFKGLALFSLLKVFPYGFYLGKVFNEARCITVMLMDSLVSTVLGSAYGDGSSLVGLYFVFGIGSLLILSMELVHCLFTSLSGLEQGPWLIRNIPIILTKWLPNLALTKDKVTKVPVWVKMHKVPVVADSEDGLSLIATQIRKPFMIDAFTSTMCADPWGRMGYARALIKVSAEKELKQ